MYVTYAKIISTAIGRKQHWKQRIFPNWGKKIKPSIQKVLKLLWKGRHSGELSSQWKHWAPLPLPQRVSAVGVRASVTPPPTCRTWWASWSLSDPSLTHRTSAGRQECGWVPLTTMGHQWVGNSLRDPFPYPEDFDGQVRLCVSSSPPGGPWQDGKSTGEPSFHPEEPDWTCKTPRDNSRAPAVVHYRQVGLVGWNSLKLQWKYELNVIHINTPKLFSPKRMQDSPNWPHRRNSGEWSFPYTMGSGSWVNIWFTVEC